MSQTHTVTINGRQYDPITGLPTVVPNSQPTPKAPPQSQLKKETVPAAKVHSVLQKSQTLRRNGLIKPAQKPIHEIKHHTIGPQVMPTATKSPMVAKFAPRSAVILAPSSPVATAPKPQPNKIMMDIAPIRHPHEVKLQARQEATTPSIKPAHVIKNEAIEEAVANTHTSTEQVKKRWHPRLVSILTASFALVLLGGYLTYLNMPSLSVRVAAAAAGVNASYPDYRPDGYRLDGAVAYSSGQVSLKFAANAGPQNFTIKQTKSSWDSNAVLDNYVTPKAGSDYNTYTDRGLTIYTFGSNAAWVNGGVLYTIEGNAPLSNEQIQHIATSFI